MWYRKAAEQGDAKAMAYLGLCYECGDGVGLDVAEALKWYRKAADLGSSLAKESLDRLKTAE